LEGANDVEAALSIVSRMQQDFDRLDVPPRFAHFHSLAQSALSQWSVGLVEMYRGIRTGQQVGVDRGKATVSRGNGLLAQAQNELHRIRDQGNPYR
jgi:hypothetical protein